MTTLPRAATSPELTKLRSDNQSSRLYLTIHSPSVVYSARLSSVPSSTDKVASITYSSGSGTLASVLQDMTLLVGSSAGASDYGIARIRKDGTTTAGTFYIGETSEINWVSNAYLTVLDEFALWPRHIAIDTDGTTPLMDYDVVYTNQNTTEGAYPTAILGPNAVLWLRGASVAYYPDASSSWVKDGTITDYAWLAPGSSAVIGLDTATPTIEYDTVGTYRISLTVTGDNGVSDTGYRTVTVVDESSGVTTQFTLDSCAGDVSSGGWSYSVTLYDEATQALIRDRALCILHAVDYYGNTRGSVGYCAGNENIVALGWIAGESITRATEDRWSTVSFDVQGPQYWLGQMTAFPSGVKDVSDATTPNKWTKFRGLTLNKALYHFMRWRCTATRCMDVYPNTDTRRHKRLESPGGENIWSQLVEICQRSMLVNPLCDRYGRIFFELDQQLVSDRSSMPTVQALTTADWQGEIRMERRIADEVSLIDMSGIAWSGTAATSFFSLAPGHVFNHYGSVEVVDRLMLVDQASTNTLCGLYSAWKNNEYPAIDISLAANHRLFDITPYQRFTLAQAAADTPRGLVEALTIIPRSITYQFNNGVMLTDATFESEVTADIAVTGDTPVDPPDPPIAPIDPPIDPPPIDPGIDSDATEVWLGVAAGIIWSSDYFAGGQPTWNKSAWPTGTTPIQCWHSYDGSIFYAYCADMSGSKMYKTTDPKSASPTWEDITPGAYSLNRTIIWKNHLITHLVDGGGGHTYADYNGTSWYTYAPLNTMINYSEVCYRAFVAQVSLDGLGNSNYTLNVAGGAETQLGVGFTSDDNYAPWQNFSSGPRYMVRKKAGEKLKIYRMDSNTLLLDINQDVPGVNNLEKPLRGAYAGNQLQYADSTGVGWISDNGSAFTSLGTWAYGIIEDTKWNGGGSLMWAIQTITQSAVPTRIYTRAGLSVDMTGNFWSLVSGTQTLCGVSVVF